ncbi:MAG TPA: hypothetical protein VK463_21280 [Desulfomonilaceae bacterium]|nr:hypothetical protein [Desulfomonilaceae bacterium]
MSVDKPINDLIEAGWHVLESDFDDAAFHHWKKQVFYCLSALLGPDHAYAECFREHVGEAEKKNILTGSGILTAAREQLSPKLIKSTNCLDA